MADKTEKIKVYREKHGEGSKHADKEGWCWCASHPATNKVAYLTATEEKAAVEEAIKKFGSEVSEIEVVA